MLRNRFIVPDWHCFTVQVCTITYVYASPLPDGEHRDLRDLREFVTGRLSREGTIALYSRRPYRGIHDYHYLQGGTQYLVYRADPRAPRLSCSYSFAARFQLDPLLIDLSPCVELRSSDRPKIATNGEFRKYSRNPEDFYFFFAILISSYFHDELEFESSLF